MKNDDRIRERAAMTGRGSVIWLEFRGKTAEIFCLFPKVYFCAPLSFLIPQSPFRT